MTKAPKQPKKTPTKMTQRDLKAEAESLKGWCLNAAMGIRRNAYVTDMTPAELDVLVQGILHGFPGDGTQDVVVPLPAATPAVVKDDEMMTLLRAELAKLAGKAEVKS